MTELVHRDEKKLNTGQGMKLFTSEAAEWTPRR